MSDTANRILQLSAQGYCCSQIMVRLGLDSLEEDNPNLVDAVAGLCGGLCSGLCCGTLTGAACLLSMFDKETARSHMIPSLVEWFQATYTPLYGGIDCRCIVGADGGLQYERCPAIMEETVARCRSLLAGFGYRL